MKHGNDNLALWIKRINMIIQKTNKIVAAIGIDQKAITSFIPTWTEDNLSREKHPSLAITKLNNCTKHAKSSQYRQMSISKWAKLWKGIQKIQNHKPQNTQIKPLIQHQPNQFTTNLVTSFRIVLINLSTPTSLR